MDSEVLGLDSMHTCYNIDQDLILYIPYISKEIGTDYISKLFNRLSIADVQYIHFENIDMLHNSATIYMNSWYHTQCVENLQEKINNSTTEARVIYDDPAYWVLYNNANCYTAISLADRLNILEENLVTANSVIKTQTDEVIRLSKKIEDFNNNSIRTKRHYYKNNSCCGAASDAWIPSYPSQKGLWNN
jgi:hypothetical protein